MRYVLIVISHIETLEWDLFVVKQNGAYGKHYRLTKNKGKK